MTGEAGFLWWPGQAGEAQEPAHPFPGRAAACFPHPGSRQIAEACVTLLGGGQGPHLRKAQPRPRI